MSACSLRPRVLAAALALLLIASLALTAAVAPAPGPSKTGRAMSRAGFAYLGGLRTFSAAVLWNRIEPIFHDYYEEAPIDKQTYMLPTLYLVTALDPQFTQAYYLSSYMVGRVRGFDEGVALAREGVRANPNSGLLHSNLAQLLYLQDKTANRAEILSLISLALSADAVWLDDEERYEGYIVMSSILKDLGQGELAARIDAVLEQMRAAGIGLGDHDHDGDGKQDH